MNVYLHVGPLNMYKYREFTLIPVKVNNTSFGILCSILFVFYFSVYLSVSRLLPNFVLLFSIYIHDNLL
jgi:hypothetical protein